MPEERIAAASKPRYKRPESVLVVVYTRMGEVLLMRRTRPADFWQSVTGSLAWGESPMQAARRELFEETGLMAGNRLVDLGRSVRFPILPAWRGRYAHNARSNLEHWFALPLSQRCLIRINRDEHSAYRWLAYPQAMRLVSSWTNRDAIQALLSQTG
jgi:dATP pyrophosphohydrolase